MNLSLAHGLVERASTVRDWTQDYDSWIKAFLAFREHRRVDALSTMDTFLAESSTENIRRLGDNIPGWRAGHLFIRAMLCAQLGRADEARRDFDRAREHLKLALGDKPGHDRDRNWASTYAGEAMQKEAEALFQAKRIPLGEPAAKRE